MQIGMIGLGRMGANIARRLMRCGHTVVGYDANQTAVKALEGAPENKAIGAASLEDMVRQLAAPRAVWVMLPAGKITEDTIAHLGGLLSKGDAVIDGGNSFFEDDIRHSIERLAKERAAHASGDHIVFGWWCFLSGDFPKSATGQ